MRCLDTYAAVGFDWSGCARGWSSLRQRGSPPSTAQSNVHTQPLCPQTHIHSSPHSLFSSHLHPSISLSLFLSLTLIVYCSTGSPRSQCFSCPLALATFTHLFTAWSLSILVSHIPSSLLPFLWCDKSERPFPGFRSPACL